MSPVKMMKPIAVPLCRDPVAARAEPEREIEDQRELGELRRLETHRPHAEPARGAVHVRADARDEDRTEQHDRDDQQRQRKHAVAVIVDAARGEHADQTDRGPERLPPEEVARIVERVERLDPARAVDHRDPDEREGQDDDDQDEVIRGPARQARQQSHDRIRFGERAHQRGVAVAALIRGREHVERRARGRQQHDVARLSEPARRGDGVLQACSPARPSRPRALAPAASSARRDLVRGLPDEHRRSSAFRDDARELAEVRVLADAAEDDDRLVDRTRRWP